TDPTDHEVSIRLVSTSQLLLIEHLGETSGFRLDGECLVVSRREPFPNLGFLGCDNRLPRTDRPLEHSKLFVCGSLGCVKYRWFTMGHEKMVEFGEKPTGDFVGLTSVFGAGICFFPAIIIEDGLRNHRVANVDVLMYATRNPEQDD